MTDTMHRMTPERFQQLARLPADTRSGPERELWDALVAERMGESELARLERELAERCAADTLECECVHRDDGWLDTTTYGTVDPVAELRYLDLRGLLERHPENPDWVRVKEPTGNAHD